MLAIDNRIVRGLSLVLALFFGFSWGGSAAAQFFQPRNEPPEELFLLAPRPLTRLLREGENAFREGRYAEGIAAIYAVLLDDSEELPEDLRGQDFFIEPGPRGLFSRSVKGEAGRLLAEMPAEGRRTLEIQFGVTARRQLEQAIAAQDFEAIGDVARKYLHTDAGYDAQVLWAQYKLTGGYPLAAAGVLQGLMNYPAARARYGPGLARAAAQAWLLAGNSQAAALTLKLAARDFPGGSIEVQGEQIAWELSTDWGPALQRLAEEQNMRVDATARAAWMTSGGSPERNAISETGMPLPTERWVKEIHSSLPEQEAILGQMELERQKGSVLLPKFELRMVGDLVLTKTSDASLLAIDFETGVIQWPFYFHNAPVPLTSVPFAPNGASNSLVSYELMNRLWGSSAFGRFSCDEQRFYFVSNEQPLSSERVFRAQADAEDTNYLEGASLSAQGAILWRVGGGSGGDEPRLAGAYFLGPPLPYEGELYALVEIKGETTLAVLDAATGHLRWKQQLVHANAPLLQYDAERKSQALSPTIADGVILCPTGVGAVAAVDLLSRSLRWGATYTTERANDRHGFRAQRSAFGESPNFSPLDRRWLDPAMIAQDGVVLISPPESDSMFCRDILTGQPRLEPQRRNANRYIAGLREGNIITVGERHVTATQLGTGSPLWTCEFPAGLTLAGKGLWQAESLLLPLSDRTVIRVRTADGKITDQAQVAQPLGNLFAYKNQLLSVSASSVSVYYTRDALAEQVQTALAKNPQDTWALNQQSQLAVARGELQPAIEALTKSFELEPDNADTRYLLVETLLEGLSEDFARFEGYAQQYADIVEFGPQRFRFLQQLALGKIRGGQSLAAFERLLDLIPQVGSTFAAAQNRQRGLQLAADYSVDSDTWIATELARAYQGASPAERQEMDRWIEGELAATERTMVPLRREQLRFLRWLPGAHAALQELATGLLGGEEQTTAEYLLQPLLHSPHAEQRAQAMRLLRQPTDTDFVRFAGQMEQVARAIAELERLEAYPPQNAGQTSAAELALLHPPRPWNDGMVHIDASSDGGYFYGVVVESEAERYGRPPLSIALSGSTVLIRNGNGEDVAHFDYPRASGDLTDVLARATVRGGLLLIETSTEIAAFDIYRGLAAPADALLWRQSLFKPGAGPTREFAMPEIASPNTPFGFTLNYRQMPGKQQAIVGPLTPSGIVVQIGTQVQLLDALSGRQLWSRDGYDDQVRLAGQGLEVAIVNPSLGEVQIVDCRDGATLRKLEYRGDWRHWFAHDAWVVDYEEARTVPPLPATLRVWNALSGEEFMRLKLPVGSRADVCEGRYLVVAEPRGKLHYFDLNSPQEIVYAQQQVEMSGELETISAQRFQDRLVVLTNSRAGQLAPDLVPVHGHVYALHTETGALCWSRPGKLFNLHVPESQPRSSPFMVAFRFNPQERLGQRATLALIDLRSGRLAYSTDSLPLRANVGFAMSLRPNRQTIHLGLGARSFRFTITDEPRPPQPVFVFGYERR